MEDHFARPNRRLYYRQPMYQRIDVRAAGVRVAVPATLVDISGGGCRLHARTMLKPRVAVEFELPRPDQAPLRVAGRIRNAAYTPEDRTFRYAIAFEGLEGFVREQLLRFVLEEQRRSIRSVKRPIETAPPGQPPLRLRELRRAPRIEINVPVLYSIGDSIHLQQATAVDVSTGGIRLILDQVLRQEWVVAVRFTLPNDILKVLAQAQGSTAQMMRPFSEVKMLTRPLPGVRQSRGRFVQSLAFAHTDTHGVDEIARFVQTSKLMALGR